MDIDFDAGPGGGAGTGPTPTHPPNPRPVNPPSPSPKPTVVALLVAAALTLLLSVAGCWGDGYETCRDAVKAGAAPLHRGDTGWNPQLDGDGDGVACENARSPR